MNVAENINRKFKAIIQDITGEIHHIEIFTTLNAAKNFIRRKIDETSGALNGEVQEITTEVHKIENTVTTEVKADVKKVEALPVTAEKTAAAAVAEEGEDITDAAKKVLDKAK